MRDLGEVGLRMAVGHCSDDTTHQWLERVGNVSQINKLWGVQFGRSFGQTFISISCRIHYFRCNYCNFILPNYFVNFFSMVATSN